MLFLLASTLSLASSLKWDDELTLSELERADTYELFKQWQQVYNKEYSSNDETHRYMVFVDNLHKIASINSQDHTFKLRANQFAAMTKDEFRRYIGGEDGSCMKDSNGNKLFEDNESKTFEPNEPASAPASVDWDAYGCVTPIKNQGQCGSCWAFASTGCIECNYCINHNKQLHSLSEQQLVDCTESYGNYGCNGGWWYNAFDYVMKEGGLCTEKEYPYTAHDGTCKASTCGTKYDPITASVRVTPDSDTSLENAVAQGCVAVGVEADQTSFQFYSSGVLTGLCGTSIDHGVLAVGYGTTGTQEYWKVKNSWGESWGDQGYIYICKDCNKNGREGECGINMYPYIVNK